MEHDNIQFNTGGTQARLLTRTFPLGLDGSNYSMESKNKYSKPSLLKYVETSMKNQYSRLHLYSAKIVQAYLILVRKCSKKPRNKFVTLEKGFIFAPA